MVRIGGLEGAIGALENGDGVVDLGFYFGDGLVILSVSCGFGLYSDATN